MQTGTFPTMSGTITFIDVAVGLAVTAVFAMLGLIAARRRRAAHEAWVANAAVAEGTVMRVRESDDVETVTTHTPVIVYRVGGQEFSIDGKTSDKRVFEVGARVTVAYQPGLPAAARVVAIPATTTHEWINRTIALVVIALIATVASAVLRT